MNEKYWRFVKQLMQNMNYKPCKPCKFVEANKIFVKRKYAQYLNYMKIKDSNQHKK
mgnify:CR=1 FL=1